MRRIDGHALWLGNAGDVREPRQLFALEIEAVIDLAGDEPVARLPRELFYCRFPLIDAVGNPVWLLRSAITNLAELLRNRRATLVFCGHGMSRSPAIAAAAIALVSGHSPEQTLAQVMRAAPHDVTPGLWQDVRTTLASLTHCGANIPVCRENDPADRNVCPTV